MSNLTINSFTFKNKIYLIIHINFNPQNSEPPILEKLIKNRKFHIEIHIYK